MTALTTYLPKGKKMEESHVLNNLPTITKCLLLNSTRMKQQVLLTMFKHSTTLCSILHYK